VTDVEYLRPEDVVAMNAHFVGEGALRDFGLLDSAVHRPQTTIWGEDAYPSLVEKAAALMHSLARNHAFIDGNKRTAAMAVVIFLEMNGSAVHIEDGVLVALALGVAEGLFDVTDVAQQLKELLQ
jgi:death-on-curing protein